VLLVPLQLDLTLGLGWTLPGGDILPRRLIVCNSAGFNQTRNSQEQWHN